MTKLTTSIFISSFMMTSCKTIPNSELKESSYEKHQFLTISEIEHSVKGKSWKNCLHGLINIALSKTPYSDLKVDQSISYRKQLLWRDWDYYFKAKDSKDSSYEGRITAKVKYKTGNDGQTITSCISKPDHTSEPAGFILEDHDEEVLIKALSIDDDAKGLVYKYYIKNRTPHGIFHVGMEECLQDLIISETKNIKVSKRENIKLQKAWNAIRGNYYKFSISINKSNEEDALSGWINPTYQHRFDYYTGLPAYIVGCSYKQLVVYTADGATVIQRYK